MWTCEPPGKAGWYWFKIVDPDVPEGVVRPTMLLVSRGADGSLWVEDTVNRERYQLHEIKGLWAGPPRPTASISARNIV